MWEQLRGTWWYERMLARGRWVSTGISAIGSLGGAFTVSDILSRIGGWSAHEPLPQFREYIWATFLLSVGLWTCWLVFYRSVRFQLREAEALISSRDAAIAIQHRMAEAVRRCARQQADFNVGDELNQIGTKVADYLRDRLGHQNFSITIKVADAHANELVTIFRDSGQDLTKRRHFDRMALASSVVYERFRKETARARKTVLIRDTDMLPSGDAAYTQRSRTCGYRSVLAFPLREPVVLSQKGGDPEAIKCANLMGFMSIDAPTPDAFAGLFQAPRTGSKQRDDGEDLEPMPDMELFYGLADAVAAVLVLQGGRP